MKKSNKSMRNDSKIRELTGIINDLRHIDAACIALNDTQCWYDGTISQLEKAQIGLVLRAEHLIYDEKVYASEKEKKYIAWLRYALMR